MIRDVLDTHVMTFDVQLSHYLSGLIQDINRSTMKLFALTIVAIIGAVVLSKKKL